MSEKYPQKPNQDPKVSETLTDLKRHTKPAPESKVRQAFDVSRVVGGNHAPVNALTAPALASAENKRLGIKQKLVGIVVAGGDSFGIVRTDTDRSPRLFLTSFAKDPAERAIIVGEFLPDAAPISIGRATVPGLSPLVSRQHFTVGAMHNGELKINESSANDTMLVTATSELPGIEFNPACFPRSEELLHWQNGQAIQPARAVGSVAVGVNPELLPPPEVDIHHMLR